jgi:hypothetical protein
MAKHRRRTVEWMLRAVETVAVFSAMSWALFWAMTHRRSASPRRGSRRARIGEMPPVVMSPGQRLESDDPDGGGALERGRRRRHID